MKKFLLIKPSSLGDVLHAFPAVNALCRYFPDSQVDWVIHPAFAQLLDYLPCVHRKILFHRKEMGTLSGFFAEFPKFYRALRLERYDAVIDLQGLLRSAFFGFCAKSEIHAGPNVCKEMFARVFYNRRLCFTTMNQHALVKNNEMIQCLYPQADLDFRYILPERVENKNSFRRVVSDVNGSWLSSLKKIGIAPGARWESKTWEPEFFQKVMEEIRDMEPEVVFYLFGSVQDTPLAERIISLSPGINTVNLCGKTNMGELVEGIRAMDVFLTNDSGPMHVAAAVDTPVAALFGPTSPVLTGPYTEKKVIFHANLDCIPCFKRYCDNAVCHAAINTGSVAEETVNLMRGYK